jgi:hypothetical protein
MTNAQKAAITTWVQSLIALAALFVPGLTDAMQIAIMAASTSTLTLWIALTYKDSPTRMNDDSATAFEDARVRLATKTGLMMPSIAEAAPTPPTITPKDSPVAASTEARITALEGKEPPKDGWPPPQERS